MQTKGTQKIHLSTPFLWAPTSLSRNLEGTGNYLLPLSSELNITGHSAGVGNITLQQAEGLKAIFLTLKIDALQVKQNLTINI